MDSSIDSVRLKINTGFVDFTEKGVSTLVNMKGTFDVTTGEITEDEFKRNAFEIKENGILSRLLVRNIQLGFNEGAHKSEVLEIFISSKMLKGKYLKGITQETIRDIYDYLMSLELFHIYYDKFLENSTCTDIDFKTDRNNMPPDKAQEFFKYLSIQGGELHNQKGNKGLSYSHRARMSKII